MVGCEDLPEPDHYFLDGYPQLIFRTSAGNPVPTEFFIARMSENSSQYYQVLDTALQLTYRKDGRPYSGYIRTYHRGRYNIEGTFRNGSIERLRFWHPNRILGMDLMVSSNVGQVWNLDGARSISWNGKERILFNPLTQRARGIHDDTLSTFFNFRGEVSYYTLRADSMSYSYYTDGSPRFFLPNGLSGNGEVRRWYPNGQLRAQGQYRNWRQVGTWIEYDTTGVEINREEFGE